MLAHPSGLVLPVATLTLVTYALFSRYMRSSAIDSLAQDYIKYRPGQGPVRKKVLWRHLLRNSLVPVTTLIGLSLPAVLTAGLVLEDLFNFQGLGLEYFNAATTDDFPVCWASPCWSGWPPCFGNLLADIDLRGARPKGPLLKMAAAAWHFSSAETEHLPEAEGGEVYKQGSVAQLVFRTFTRNKLAVIGVVIVVLNGAVLLCRARFFTTPTRWTRTSSNSNLAPSASHLLGTDNNGYDILGRLMVGGQSSIEIGLSVACIATFLGVVYGAIAGYFGKLVDTVMMRVVDIMLAIPVVFLFIFVSTRDHAHRPGC